MVRLAPDRMERSAFRAMGTEVVVIAPEQRVEAVAAVDQLFAEWDARMSRFRSDSELAALNAAAGSPVAVSDLLFQVADAAVRAADATDGLFDPLLAGPMVELGYDRTFDELPVDRAVDDRPTGWRPGRWREVRLDREHRTVELPSGTGMDLGGIAKGMAVDAAIASLRALEVPWAAVDAGGDLGVIGRPPGKAAWTIGIDAGLHRVVSLSEGALATSSILGRTWRVNGKPRHHIVDPRTGLPARTGVAQVSVAAATCREAEVAAKAALLLGPCEGAAFLERHGLSGLLITQRHTESRVGAWH